MTQHLKVLRFGFGFENFKGTKSIKSLQFKEGFKISNVFQPFNPSIQTGIARHMESNSGRL